MTGRLRIVETGIASGRWNTALSAALLRCGSERPGDVCIRFYRFKPCVLLGAHQRYESACIDFCIANGIEIARRVTGGGNVYMSPTMLAWDVVMPQSASVESLSAGIAAALAAALRSLGYAGVTSAPTGLAMGGRKISGAAMGSERGTFLYQGTLLVEDEASCMAAALAVSLSSLEAHVTCLRAAGPDAPDLGRLQDALASHLASAIGLESARDRLTAQEEAMAAYEYGREIGTDAFVRGEEFEMSGGQRA